MNGKNKKPVDPLVYIVEATCPICGKVFVPAPYHIYKQRSGRTGHKYYCSYSCYNRRYEKKDKQHDVS